ncbi:hypothetical protein Mal4_39720 [Maioricimonas rarisocia]|uniref:Uncharacterized protein n=1 Tax=Maioricimonas rarisocia TaxID=2528026 RepID=A0A517ZAU3_9PLAN|nr:hypothetical protein [Maioricimonas rarisocia]QDU39626.1 hypothetical protein Mal4_39720 [Maioricimonas rarisocia]
MQLFLTPLRLSQCLRYCYFSTLLILATCVRPALVVAEEPSPESFRDSDPADFGIVIRLSEQLFQKPGQDVARVSQVRETVLGVHNVGTANVSGTLIPDFRPKQDGIAMDLVFSGTSVSRTVGRQRSARIHSTTSTRVVVRTPVNFELESGFTSGPSVAEASLLSGRRCIGTDAHGLRGLIVRRVARRRIREQQYQIQVASERATGHRVAEETELEVRERLRVWNSHWEPLRQIIVAQPWYSEDRDVHYASDEKHLLLYIEGDPSRSDGDLPRERTIRFPPKTLPPAKAGGLVDVVIYDDPSQKAKVAAVLALVEAMIDEYTANQPIADRVSFETSVGRNWTMLSVGTEEASGKAD